MNVRVGTFTQRELTERLARCSDEEITSYNQRRLKQAKYFYIGALACGITAIPLAIENFLWVTIPLGIVGIILLQWGRYKRAKWGQLYRYLMSLRAHQQQVPKKGDKRKDTAGEKYRRHRDGAPAGPTAPSNK